MKTKNTLLYRIFYNRYFWQIAQDLKRTKNLNCTEVDFSKKTFKPSKLRKSGSFFLQSLIILHDCQKHEKSKKIVKKSYAFSLSTRHTPCPQGLVLQGLLFSKGSSWDTDTPTNIRPMAKRPKMWTLSKAITFRLPSSPTFNWKHRKRPHAHELLLPAVKVAERKVSSGATDYEAVLASEGTTRGLKTRRSAKELL